MFDIQERGAAVVAIAPSQLDAGTSGESRETLLAAISSSRPRMVIDMSMLGFVDSAGLGVLVAALKTSRAAGGDVRLCGVTPTVRSILDMTRLSQKFGIYDSVEDALASFG